MITGGNLFAVMGRSNGITRKHVDCFVTFRNSELIQLTLYKLMFSYGVHPVLAYLNIPITYSGTVEASSVDDAASVVHVRRREMQSSQRPDYAF